jgi:hypothetical protein
MNSSATSSSVSSEKPIFACIRCSERKVRCDKNQPCQTCVRHNDECYFRPPKPPRRNRKLVTDILVYEQLKHYESLLRENAIDPNRAINSRKSIDHYNSHSLDVHQSIQQLPAISTASERQATDSKPQLLHGPTGTTLVAK